MTRNTIRKRVALALAGALTGFGPFACGSSGLVGGTCAEGYSYCGECVDLSSDEDHCGACDRRCGEGEVCIDGVCEGDGVGGGPGGADGSGGSGVGGSGVGGSGGSGVGGNGAGGTGFCLPPFDDAEACGDCDTSCSGEEPVCAPVGGSFECSESCETAPFDTNCGGKCVDTETDPEHCGGCFAPCSSGICVGGSCVGVTPGHMIALCMNYQFYSASAAQTILLGNAIFLTGQDPVRILAYTGSSPTALENGTDAAIQAAASARGRTFEITHESSATIVEESLDRADYDVLLVYDQTSAASGSLATLGADWASETVDFAEEGGVVIALTGGGGTGEMDQFVSALGIVEVTGFTVRTGERFYVQSPSDALAVNLVSPFRGVQQSCVFETTDVSGDDLVFVVSDTDPGTGAGAPAVAHRIVTP